MEKRKYLVAPFCNLQMKLFQRMLNGTEKNVLVCLLIVSLMDIAKAEFDLKSLLLAHRAHHTNHLEV
jgi:hypothetical protein